MLGSMNIVAFVPTTDADRARSFYEGVLGLRFVSQDPFAAVFDANGIMLRAAKVPPFQPARFTVLGWEVPDIEGTVRGLQDRGVVFQRYEGIKQDSGGIWTAPGGAKVAWFKDPDGNILSVSKHT